MNTSFFLGANSAHGFYSLYKELIDLKEAHAVYILKGGPGSGKSTLMRNICKKAESMGYATEKIYCSSDPDSLDAVVFPDIGIALVDGTAPHIVEPEYPIAVEQYVNLGQFTDAKKIKDKKEEIMACKTTYSKFFPHIYRLTAAAAHIENEIFDIALGGIAIDNLKKRIKGIVSRSFREKGSGCIVKKRFLSAISPKGHISLLEEMKNDIETDFEHIYLLNDNFGIGHFLLSSIEEACKASDLSYTLCLDPLIPERAVHIFIPELSLAFITSTKTHTYTGRYSRRINLDSSIDKTVLKENKNRLSLLLKLRNSILDDACSVMKEAKLVHDKLESLYRPYIDFPALSDFSEKLANKIFSDDLSSKK